MPLSEADAPPLEVSPRRRAAASLIWLHGLGADAEDLLPAVEMLAASCSVPLHFILPRAPLIAVSLYRRFRLRAWFDVVSDDFEHRASPEAIDAAVRGVEALLQRERARGMAGGRVLIAGFSQGGAVALHAGLRHAGPLLGLAALSSYLPLPEMLVPAVPLRALFLAHAADDEVVPIAVAEKARDWLAAQGHDVSWHVAGHGHSIDPAIVAELAKWLQTRLAAT